MSGGSFNYLCHKDETEIRGWQELQDLEHMAERLAALGYASDAARETTALLLTLRQQQVLVGTYLERLGPVWRAMEWWSSCDSSEESFKSVLAEYRGET